MFKAERPTRNNDSTQNSEQGVGLPWSRDPAGSYLYYDCTVDCMLDSGIVVHNRLPQINNLPDSLASLYLDDPNIDQYTNRGVNLKSNDQFTDIVQRMGHARYYFRLYGRAIRVGYQIPIPALKTIGGVAAIPYDQNPQRAFNKIQGNYSGVILWYAEWSLWYTTALPPTTNTVPNPNPAAHIDGTVAPPAQMQAPFSQPDDNAVQGAQPPTITIGSKR